MNRLYSVFIIIIIAFFLSCQGDFLKNSKDAETLTNYEIITIVSRYLDASSFTFAIGNNSFNVTRMFTMPISGFNGTTITWVEKTDDKNNTVLFGTGNGSVGVTQPACGESDEVVILTAIMTKESEQISKDIQITIKNGRCTGDIYTYRAGTGSATFNMVYVPGGITFPTGIVDDGNTSSVENTYLIGETEVTYKLWKVIYEWAVSGTGGAAGEGNYTFSNEGKEGNTGVTGGEVAGDEPVTTISWRDTMIWLNALTEYYNAKNGTSFEPVYYTNGNYTTPIRNVDNSTSICTVDGCQDKPYIKASAFNNTDMNNCTATGFRMLTSDEFIMAERYIGKESPSTGGTLDTEYVALGHLDDNTGSLTPGYYWTPHNYASGAIYDSYSSEAQFILSVAVCNAAVTFDVKDRAANALGIYDMNGNAAEWVFNLSQSDQAARLAHGYSYKKQFSFVVVNGFYEKKLYSAFDSIGFRIAKSTP